MVSKSIFFSSDSPKQAPPPLLDAAYAQPAVEERAPAASSVAFDLLGDLQPDSPPQQQRDRDKEQETDIQDVKDGHVDGSPS
jgi:hypothetical protein